MALGIDSYFTPIYIYIIEIDDTMNNLTCVNQTLWVWIFQTYLILITENKIAIDLRKTLLTYFTLPFSILKWILIDQLS